MLTNKFSKNSMIILLTLIMVIALSVVSSGVHERYDFNGATVKIAPFRGDFDSFLEAGSRLNDQLLRTEENFNVNIEFVGMQWSTLVEDIISSIIAGDPVADILYLHAREWPILAGEGVLMDLTEYLDDDYWSRQPPTHRHAQDGYKIAGRFYGYNSNGWYNYDNDHKGGIFLFWNKSLFERENLPDPRELEATGEWTWDAFAEIVKKARRDTTGDGSIDQFGFVREHWEATLNYFIYANGGRLTREEDGFIRYALDNPEVIEAIRFVQEFELDEEIGHISARWNGHFMTGQAAMALSTAPNNRMADFPEDWGILMPPLGPSASMEERKVRGDWNRLSIMVTTEHDPEALIELTNSLMAVTEEYRDMSAYNEETMADRIQWLPDRESVAVWEWYQENSVLQTFRDIGRVELEIWDEVVEAIRVGEKSIAATLERYRSPFQTILDDMLGQ